MRRLLLCISLLDRVELDVCARLYPEADSRRLLPELVRRNVFTTVASDSRGEEYRLHPLFRSFLQRRFRHEVGRYVTAVANGRGRRLRYADVVAPARARLESTRANRSYTQEIPARTGRPGFIARVLGDDPTYLKYYSVEPAE